MCILLCWVQLCLTLWPHELHPARLLCPWVSPGKNTGMGCHFLLQGIFLTQEVNPGLLHQSHILYRLNYEGNHMVISIWIVLLLYDFPGGSDGKASVYNTGVPVRSLGREDPLEKEMAIHSSTVARKIPWTEELGRLQSIGSQRVGHDWVTSLSYFYMKCLFFFNIFNIWEL